MHEYLPILIVGALIGVFTVIFLVIYGLEKNKKETMGFESLDKLTPMGDYAPDTQCFYVNDEYDKLNIGADEFVIFFPNEPHAPGAAFNDIPSKVKKIVVKIKA